VPHRLWLVHVDPARTEPPADTEIYTLIPGTAITAPWHPGVGEPGPTFTTADIRADPHYKGGLIGFALRGDPNADCKQTHFSEQELNVSCTNCTPIKSWAAALIWQSTATPNAYYIGFEDLAMSPTDFGGFPGQPYRNDGDFNDFVYFLSGLTCDGGGTPCDTAMPGVCAAGLSECVTGTTLRCRPSINPSPEVCDGLDNDCNGMVDDNAACPQHLVCDRGACVPPCGDVEFPCALNKTCVSGLCVETACIGKVCAAGTVCKNGTCVGSCDGVSCPKEQVCRLGRCVDPCASVTCDSDRVCDGGVCVPMCSCRGCQAGQACAPSGRCVDGGCAAKICGAGTVCVAGACTDACALAVCPKGQICTAGNCVDTPAGDGGVSTGSGGSSGGGGSSGSGGTSASAGSDGASGANGSDAAAGQPDGGASGIDSNEKIGCRCDLDASSGPVGWLGCALALFGASVRRRRRAGRPR
jgi:hypothetical protein